MTAWARCGGLSLSARRGWRACGGKSLSAHGSHLSRTTTKLLSNKYNGDSVFDGKKALIATQHTKRAVREAGYPESEREKEITSLKLGLTCVLLEKIPEVHKKLGDRQGSSTFSNQAVIVLPFLIEQFYLF